jgi:Prokaryotic dksA/traR C4-type zinc finger
LTANADNANKPLLIERADLQAFLDPHRMRGNEIPEERLQAIPDTLVCVRCSKKIGGEFELKVTVGSVGKAGSLKKRDRILR